MAILIDQQIIDNQHPIQRIPNARNAQGFAAVQIVLINRHMVFLLLRLHHIPCADQLGIRRDEILTNAVWEILLHQQAIRSVRNAEAFHQQR